MSRRRQSVTIRHVAADAGVSLQTVSRVINKEPGVRPEMLHRVQASIAKLGYVPSLAAQRMSGSRSYLILALNDRERTIADWRAREGRDWVDQMLLGGMLACSAHGYRMIVELIDTQSDQIARELGAAIAALQPDGAILTPPHSQNPLILRLLAEKGIEIARIGSVAEGPGHMLVQDDRGSARLATEHLLALGHRRIGFIGGPAEYDLSAWRIDGWRAAMAAAGISSEGLLEMGDFSYDTGLVAARTLLDRAEVTAVIAANDQTALATLAAVRGRGRSVPEDVSLISFDDTPIVRFVSPALTAVSQPIADITAKAAECIIDACAGRAPASTEPIVLPSTLIVRESTRRPRAQ